MDILGQAVLQAIALLLQGDAEVWRVTLLSLQGNRSAPQHCGDRAEATEQLPSGLS
jgi:hypothetical protein